MTFLYDTSASPVVLKWSVHLYMTMLLLMIHIYPKVQWVWKIYKRENDGIDTHMS